VISTADRLTIERPLISGYAYLCLESLGMTSCADQCRLAGSHETIARARITTCAHKASVATFSNNRRPYHCTGRKRQPRYGLKCLHLTANSSAQIRASSRRQTAARSEQQTMPNSRRQTACSSTGKLLPGNRAP
jgi:hypothetical protein